MITDNVGQVVATEEEVFTHLLTNEKTSTFLVESTNSFIEVNKLLGLDAILNYKAATNTLLFDNENQTNWFMPVFYKHLDIVEYILDLCNTPQELERCGEELVMYQDRDLFNLLRYLLYLKDTMEEHNIIWGVGRGSSVSSYVLYKLNIHKINSIAYDLNINEFLR